MTNLPMFPEHDSGNDDTPLPLLIAKKWGFPLAYHIVDGKYLGLSLRLLKTVINGSNY